MKTLIKVAFIALLTILISFSTRATTVYAWVDGYLTITDQTPPPNHTYTYTVEFTIEYRDASTPTGPFTAGIWVCPPDAIPDNEHWTYGTTISVTYFPPEYSYYRIHYYVEKDDYCPTCFPQHVITNSGGTSSWVHIIYINPNYYLTFPDTEVKF